MGNQGNSFDWCRQIAEWIQSGIIGEVTEVHCWTDRPYLAKVCQSQRNTKMSKNIRLEFMDWFC